MKTVEIRHRWTNAVIYSTEVDVDDAYPIRTAVRRAIDARSNLSSANLRWADLTSANLTSANLRSANLRSVRDDVRAVLDLAPAEVPGLLAALVDGRVDGSAYGGECACLVGTIANVRGCNYQSLGDLTPNADRPAEKWFLAIGRGSTPDTNEVAAITHDWIAEWQSERGEGPWMVKP